jgi:hypothetical protein
MPQRLTSFPKWNDLSGKYAPKVTYFAMIAKKSISPGAGNYKGADDAYKKIGSSPLLRNKRH